MYRICSTYHSSFVIMGRCDCVLSCLSFDAIVHSNIDCKVQRAFGTKDNVPWNTRWLKINVVNRERRLSMLSTSSIIWIKPLLFPLNCHLFSSTPNTLHQMTGSVSVKVCFGFAREKKYTLILTGKVLCCPRECKMTAEPVLRRLPGFLPRPTPVPVSSVPSPARHHNQPNVSGVTPS